MNQDTESYMLNNDLDPDVFFMDAEGVISPQMRENWIEDHKLAVQYEGVDYDNDTGVYHYSFKVPDGVSNKFDENPELIEQHNSKNDAQEWSQTAAGVFVTGSTQTPGAVVMAKKMIDSLDQF